MDDELVKVSIRYRPQQGLPAGESLWARAVDAHDGGGTYSLENTAFFAALAAGDVVSAVPNGDGILQVIDVVEPADHVLTMYGLFPEHADRAAEMVERWATHGAQWSEGTGSTISTVWAVGMAPAEIAEVVAPDVAAGAVECLVIAGPADRRTEMHDHVDFELDVEQHMAPVETSYWVGDDPWWAEQGLDDPELLALVQRLAGEDARVARALERGQQERVLHYIQRITAPDPSALPPLDGPIFED